VTDVFDVQEGMIMENQEMGTEPNQDEISTNKRIQQFDWMTIAVLVVFLLGLGSGYLTWGKDETAERKENNATAALYEQINPPDGYALPVSYGDLGPQLLASGIIDFDAFTAIYTNAGTPLSADQIDILKSSSDQPIVINAENAHYLLNFFWAVGLVNRNSILTEGPMIQNSGGQYERFASTGGWTIGAKPITELYASMDLIPLTAEQQQRVEELAAAIYRPCCNNPTLFPDCNHGMAMLGLLELMASQGATTDQMFEAAKYVNAFWFPQQTMEVALYLKANQNVHFAAVDARMVVGQTVSSASGAQMVHADLQSKGLLKQAPNRGGSCSN
jgi:hypothetical protein